MLLLDSVLHELSSRNMSLSEVTDVVPLSSFSCSAASITKTTTETAAVSMNKERQTSLRCVWWN